MLGREDMTVIKTFDASLSFNVNHNYNWAVSAAQ